MEGAIWQVSLCRQGFEEPLCAELRAWAGKGDPECSIPAPGVVVWRGPTQADREAFLFERQRLPDARWHPWEKGEPPLPAATEAEHLHIFTHGEPPAALVRRVRRVRDVMAGPEAPPVHPPGANSAVTQVLVLAQGLWVARHRAALLKCPYPGGEPGLRHGQDAPSRSALKLREAWLHLQRPPAPGERVVDLGAAPGGWSRICLEQGCRVTAVDNGPMRIAGLEDLPGRLTHLRADGLRYRPPAGELPVDWLLADMLISPGVCLGLLKKWLGEGWARRLVVNIKLPQQNPLPALAPLRAWLAGQDGVQWKLRHLFHDRRELTLIATVQGRTPPPRAGATPRGAAAGKPPGRKGGPRSARPGAGAAPSPRRPGKKPRTRR